MPGPGGGLRGRAAYVPDMVGAWAWARRWQLAPVAAGLGVLGAAASAPVWAGLGLGAGAGGMWWAARTGIQPRGRWWLSTRERLVAAVWLATAGVWSLWSAIPVLPGSGSPWLLAAGLAGPSWTWATSRRIRPVEPEPSVLSPGAQLVVDRWTEAVALRGPVALQGSIVLPDTMTEPAEGAFAFTVQLAENVHGQDAAAEAARRAVEAQLRLPVGTAALAPDRDDATRLRVTLTPSRHLENASVPWPGPEMTPDGLVPIAATPDGGEIAVRYHSETGVRHGMFSGTSDAGKSTLLCAWILAGPSRGVSSVWFIDGKRGTSAPQVRGAVDWYAPKPAQWPVVIQTLYNVFCARAERRGDAGLDTFRVGHEDEPVIELWIDEASSVSKVLPQRMHAWVLEMLREGRALGIRIVQGAQDVMATEIIGGRMARDLLAGNGTVIALRPGGSQAKRLTLDSTNTDVDLTGLPPEPGFCAIVEKGTVLAKVARIRHATRTQVEDAVRSITPRPLEGADLAAAGPAYLARHTGNPTPGTPGAGPATGSRAERQVGHADGAEGPGDTTEPAGRPGGAPLGGWSIGPSGSRAGEAARARDRRRHQLSGDGPGEPEAGEPLAGQVRLARDVIAQALAGIDRPVTRGWLAHRTGLALSTVTRVLTELEAEGRAERAGRQKWRPVP